MENHRVSYCFIIVALIMLLGSCSCQISSTSTSTPKEITPTITQLEAAPWKEELVQSLTKLDSYLRSIPDFRSWSIEGNYSIDTDKPSSYAMHIYVGVTPFHFYNLKIEDIAIKVQKVCDYADIYKDDK